MYQMPTLRGNCHAKRCVEKMCNEPSGLSGRRGGRTRQCTALDCENRLHFKCASEHGTECRYHSGSSSKVRLPVPTWLRVYGGRSLLTLAYRYCTYGTYVPNYVCMYRIKTPPTQAPMKLPLPVPRCLKCWLPRRRQSSIASIQDCYGKYRYAC